MKIFISHASQDKWAARRISGELEALGATTFLDEKDIETGESIDDAIAKHLKDCDEILILLSPASVKSHWVLVEVGGAKALEKRLIPILLYLGVNEIPSPITKHLARDINAIERYYDELSLRIKTGNTAFPAPRIEPIRRIPIRRRGFKIGDVVRLPESPQEEILRDTDDPAIMRLLDWGGEMNRYFGREAAITLVDNSDRSVRLDVDNEKHWWAFEWLTKVHRPEA